MTKLTVLSRDFQSSQQMDGDLLLSDAIGQVGVDINLSCGGRGICGTCEIKLKQGRFLVQGKEIHVVDMGEPVAVKSCQTKVLSEDCVVEVPESSLVEEEAKIVSDFKIPLNSKGDINANPEDIGLAIDLGTTTVVVLAVHLATGEVIGRASDFNAQIKVGDNVATRISACVTPEGISNLQGLLIKTIEGLIRKLKVRYKFRFEQIKRVVFSGNTVVSHLVHAIDPSPIGVIPFSPQVRVYEICDASAIGLSSISSAKIYTIPSIAGYVGGDIVSDIVATDFALRKDVSLLIDIGTNGEMVLNNKGQLIGTATAAGPAFEGAGISRGMRAASGAIEKIESAPDGGLTYQMIGHGKARGFCGSALIDFMACGFRDGWINFAGRFDGADEADESTWMKLKGAKGGPWLRKIVPPEESADKRPVGITEFDVAEVLKAKGAIYAGMKSLLAETGKKISDLDHIILAGGFAAHIRIENAIEIGLLPEIPLDRYSVVGNTSLAGAYQVLMDLNIMNRMRSLIDEVKVINLAETRVFNDFYIDALMIPNADEDEFSHG